MQGNRLQLSSCFYVRARLDSGMAAVRRLLDDFPCLKLRASGTKLIYSIIESPPNGPAPLLEFCHESVALRFFFARPSRSEYAGNFTKFLSILAYLKDLYSVDFAGLYGYVIEAIHNGWSFTALESAESGDLRNLRIGELSKANAALSAEFVALASSKRKLDEKVRVYQKFVSEVLEHVQSSQEGVPGQQTLLSGIDPATARTVFSLMAEKE